LKIALKTFNRRQCYEISGNLHRDLARRPIFLYNISPHVGLRSKFRHPAPKIVMTHIRQFFAPPQFPNDEEKTRVAGVINSVLLICLLSAAASGFLLIAFAPAREYVLGQVLALVTGCLLLQRLLQRGYVLPVAIIGFLLVSASMFVEGLLSPVLGITTSLALLLAAIAGLTYGVRGMRITVGFHAILIWCSVLVKLRQAPATELTNRLMYEGITYTLVMAATLFIIQLIVRYLAAMQAKTKQSEQDLLQRNQQLEKEITERWQLERDLQQANTVLEQRVVERTQQWHQLNQSLLQEVAERKQAEEVIRHRVAFEQHVASISSKFMALPPARLDEGIQFALQSIGEFVEVDTCRFSQVIEETRQGDAVMLERTHEWTSLASKSAGKLSRVGVRSPLHMDDGWWLNQYARLGYAQITSIHTLPAQLNYARETLIRLGIKSLLMVPVMRHAEVIAILGLESVERERTWTDENIILLRLVAEIIGVALERKHNATALRAERDSLEQRVDERTRELSKLLQVTQTVSSTLELQPLLQLILQQLQEVVPYEAVGISEFDADNRQTLISYVGPIPQGNLVSDWPPYDAKDIHLVDLVTQHKPIVVADVRADEPYANALRGRYVKVLGDVPKHIASVLLVPLVLREKVMAIMILSKAQPGHYTPQHADLALAFANQATIAIENARLHAKEIHAAAIGERSRLARELHDSVSQALFGIVLGTRTALDLATRAPQSIFDPLQYVLKLSEAALAELRALIFELRPESLQTEGLLVALRKQADVLMMRQSIQTTTDFPPDEPEIALAVKEALYRIGLEAIQNVIKHSRATQACLAVHQQDNTWLLEVSDNGQGFDPAGKFPGHVGLHSMRERAAQCGASLQIESQLSKGTTVRVIVPC
jgi:signal transduction histidine kinase